MPELLPKTNLSHYRIIEKIGAGGMGEVYLAEDTRLRRKLALKVLPQNIASDKERVRRFEQEAFAVSALNHPNILTIYEFGAENDTHFLAAEFVEGVTLREKINREGLSLNEALDIAQQTAFALSAAHAAGIAHRDIKPENVMIRADGIVKVLDFGLAKLTEIREEDTDAEAETRWLVRTNPGVVMGTVSYMSPEQAKGKETDTRTDIWSFGVLLYEMLSGRLPFEGESPNEYIASILKSDPLPLENKDGEIPAELAHIFRKALRKDKDARYQTMKDLLADLKELREEIALTEKLERSAAANRIHQTENQETLPTKAETTKDAGRGQTASSAEYIATEIKRHKSFSIAAIAILLLAVGIGYWFYLNRTASTDAKQIDSIAVLPFQNRSLDADTEYLSDGLAESLIYRLSQLPNLKVSPTSSVFRYKGKETDAIKIGSELGVQAVMTGRMAQRGENLIISVELIDVRNNKLLWGEQYERKMSELLATQREIAAEITNKLQLKLSGESEQKLAKKYTDNNEAYQLYLKGRYHYLKRTKDHFHTLGIEYFEQAIKLDPNFALAYVGIANSYAIMPSYAYLSQQEAIPQSKAAAQKALAIDPTLAEAYSALAYSLAVYEWDWTAAERAYRRALELNPNVAEIHYRYAMHYLIPQGRTEEAIAEIQRALELEPLSLAMSANLAAAYMYSRQFERALEQAKKTYNLDPSHPTPHIWLGNIYNINGMYGEAVDLSERALQKDSTNQYFLWLAGYAYAKTGRRREAEEALKKFNAIAKTQYVEPYNVALIYVALEDKDKAFAELEKAFAERDWSMPFLKVDPFWEPLRNDPRFADLVKRIGLQQ